MLVMDIILELYFSKNLYMMNTLLLHGQASLFQEQLLFLFVLHILRPLSSLPIYLITILLENTFQIYCMLHSHSTLDTSLLPMGMNHHQLNANEKHCISNMPLNQLLCVKMEQVRNDVLCLLECFCAILLLNLVPDILENLQSHMDHFLCSILVQMDSKLSFGLMSILRINSTSKP